MPQVTGPITTTSPTDTYPTHDAAVGLGGLREVVDYTARNAIPNFRRREGMLVYTASDQNYWVLDASPWDGTDSDWYLFTTGATEQGPVTYTFSSPVLTWSGTHPFEDEPDVILLDDDEVRFYGDISYPATGEVLATFLVPMSGKMVIRN